MNWVGKTVEGSLNLGKKTYTFFWGLHEGAKKKGWYKKKGE